MSASPARFPTIEPAALRAGAAVRILPAGVFRAHDGRPHGIEGWRVDRAIAGSLVAARATTGADYVIDYEHQTLNAEKNGKPAPAAGWFKRLEWREGQGLFMADISWTEAARAMIAAGEYRHVSPVFRFDPTSGAVTGIVAVALTNNPGLTGLADLVAATAKPAYAAETEGISEKDRAMLEHVFGRYQEVGKLAAATSSMPPMDRATFDTAFAGESGRAKESFLHAFGDDLGLN